MKHHSWLATGLTWCAIALAAISWGELRLTDYQQQILPIAQNIREEYGIPEALTLAIATHETGDGAAVIGNHNHWGIKGDAIVTTTTEFYDGQIGYYDLGFADRGSDRLFANTIVNILEEQGHSPALIETDPTTALNLIGPVYATDPNWASAVQGHLEKISKSKVVYRGHDPLPQNY